MPSVNIPNVGTVNFPDSMSHDEIVHAIETDIIPKSQAANAPVAAQTPSPKAPQGPSIGGMLAGSALGAGAGLMDPVAAVGQMVGSNSAANLKKAMMEKAIAMGGAGPAKGGELAGQILPMLLAPEIGAVSKLGPLSQMAVKGGAQAMATPTEANPEQGYLDYLKSKGMQGLEGMGMGAAMGKAGQMIMNPTVSQGMQQLKDLGMKYFTPGQLMSEMPVIGPMAQNIEKKLSSLPLAGSMITASLGKSFEDFNKAMGNKILAPLKEKIPDNVPAGKQMIEYIQNKVGDLYNDVLQNASLKNDFYDKATKTLPQERLFNALANTTKNLNPKQSNIIEHDVVNNILNDLDMQKYYNGEQFRNQEQYLSEEANKHFTNGNAVMGRAYQNFLNAFRKELEIQNPSAAGMLSKAHAVFKGLQPVEAASAMRGATEGVFTPQQLEGRIAQSAGRSGKASGTGENVGLSEAATRILGQNVPDSGTAGRLLAASLVNKPAASLVEAGANKLTGMLPLLATGAVYNPASMRLLTKMAQDRPEVMREMAPAVSGALFQLGGALTPEGQ